MNIFSQLTVNLSRVIIMKTSAQGGKNVKAGHFGGGQARNFLEGHEAKEFREFPSKANNLDFIHSNEEHKENVKMSIMRVKSTRSEMKESKRDRSTMNEPLPFPKEFTER